MAWQIEWSDEASRDINRLERGIAARIVKKLEAAANNPSRFFERIVGYDDHKLRIGDYRVIAMLSHSSKKIFIEKIGHRKSIYKKR